MKRFHLIPPAWLLALAAVAPLPAQAPAPLTPRDSARHVLDRLAYGPTPGMVERIATAGVLPWIERQLSGDRVDDPALSGSLASFDLLSTQSRDLLSRFLEAQEIRRRSQRAGPDSAMQAMRPPAEPGEEAPLRRLLAQLPQLVLVRAVGSERQLAEVMADFWFNHFNIFVGKNLDRVLLPGYVERTIRRHALGRFEDLLVATATSPAMMIYLDNAQSIAPGAAPPLPARQARAGLSPRADSIRRETARRRPTGLNENYARELLELHTLGVNGGYSQREVTEVARILTGWSIVPPRGIPPAARRLGGAGAEPGSFQFNGWAHDRGAKRVLGIEFPAGGGQDEGIRLLRMLAAHPSTMHHVSAKLCARFVNDLPPDGCIDDAVRAWRKSDGDIRSVLRAILSSPDFWAPVNRSSKVKTPLEFVASAVRAVGGIPDSTPRLAFAVARLGQPLYQRATPDGYPEHQEDWVNSGALLERMNLGVALAAGRAPGVAVNLDRVVPADPDHGRLVESVNQAILSGRMSAHTRTVILEQIADIGDPTLARALAVGLALGGPEFQKQ